MQGHRGDVVHVATPRGRVPLLIFILRATDGTHALRSSRMATRNLLGIAPELFLDAGVLDA